MIDKLKKLERFLASVKFAVLIIMILTVAMIYGTFQESYHGAEYANRLVYKSPLFIIIQLGILLSVSLAAFFRLPAKKRLYGFYTVHLGIVLVIAGSYVTYQAGIDGNITLRQNEANRDVMLNEDVFNLYYLDRGNDMITYELPFRSGVNRLNLDVTDKIKLIDFYPFSETQTKWKEGQQKYLGLDKGHFQSAKYKIENPFTEQVFHLTLHPESKDFYSSEQLGPLALYFMPRALARCFGQESASGLIIWDSSKAFCQTLEENKGQLRDTASGKKFLTLSAYGRTYTFFPEHSQWPVDVNSDGQFDKNSSMRVFNKNLFTQNPTLFLFGDMVSYYQDGEWTSQELFQGIPADLPWMSSKLYLMEQSDSKFPYKEPYAVKPMQESGQVIIGAEKALLIEVLGRPYWLRSGRSTTLLVGGEKIKLELAKETIRLPFKLTLSKFKMDTNPGTNSPASYESFVNLFTDKGTQKHHIFMNNPLKYGGFTFYQASYFPDGDSYGSVLSVNFDPGRPLKYFGSLILVLGTMWHFRINRKRVAPDKAAV